MAYEGTSHEIKKVTPAMLKAAAQAADGMSIADIAAYHKRSTCTIRAWLGNRSVKEEYLKLVRMSLLPTVAKSIRVLEKQLGSDAGNGYLATQAATTLLGKFAPVVLEEQNSAVTITLLGGQIPLGMPPPSQSEDE